MKSGFMIMGLFLIFGSATAQADGDSFTSDQQALRDSAAASAGDTAAEADPSDTKLDPRLPPVLPGELISRGGRRTKVWSTAGPVPVGSPPAAEATEVAGETAPAGAIGVIVDRRRE